MPLTIRQWPGASINANPFSRTTVRNSRPSPSRCSSYQCAASSSSRSAAGMNWNVLAGTQALLDAREDLFPWHGLHATCIHVGDALANLAFACLAKIRRREDGAPAWIARSVQRTRLQLRSRAQRGFVSCKPLLGSTSFRFDTTQGLVRGKLEFGEFSFGESANAAMQGRLRNGPKLKRKDYPNPLEGHLAWPR